MSSKGRLWLPSSTYFVSFFFLLLVQAKHHLFSIDTAETKGEKPLAPPARPWLESISLVCVCAPVADRWIQFVRLQTALGFVWRILASRLLLFFNAISKDFLPLANLNYFHVFIFSFCSIGLFYFVTFFSSP